jgi:SAM-dependent methyltransferase
MRAPSGGGDSSAEPLATGCEAFTTTPEYWDEIAGKWRRVGEGRAWRMVSDAVNAELLSHWVSPDPGGSVLKTDLFDEVVGTGLVPWLSASFGRVAGIDISPALVAMARARFPGLRAEAADVRSLPFPDGEFDAIVSNSTLDHFPSHEDIGVALEELHRVLRRGGRLLVTFDNPLNPVIAVRNALPERLRAATRMVPFAVGATCGPRRLRALLEQTGFDVSRVGTVFHCPRLLVVLAGHLIDRHGGATTRRGYVRLWTGFERLASLPTRFLTGYFVAALAHKR